jgi:hypothetical protein
VRQHWLGERKEGRTLGRLYRNVREYDWWGTRGVDRERMARASGLMPSRSGQRSLWIREDHRDRPRQNVAAKSVPESLWSSPRCRETTDFPAKARGQHHRRAMRPGQGQAIAPPFCGKESHQLRTKHLLPKQSAARAAPLLARLRCTTLLLLFQRVAPCSRAEQWCCSPEMSRCYERTMHGFGVPTGCSSGKAPTQPCPYARLAHEGGVRIWAQVVFG